MMKESLQNIGDLIAEPSAAFSRLKSQLRWGIAFIVFYLFSVLIGWAVLPYTETLSATQLAERGLQPEQLEAAGNINQIFKSNGQLNPKIMMLFSHINPLSLWLIAVIAIAIAVLADMEKNRARVAAVILWVISILPEVVFAT